MSIIVSDIDYTVVDLTPIYWKWLECITGCRKDIDYCKDKDGLLSYDLSVYFKRELVRVNRCGLDFYRQDGLYDTLLPIPGAIGVLADLKRCGHEIVFVSAIKGRHTKSKAEFIKRFFPFHDGIVFTKEKQYVSCDVFIDDRQEHINDSKANIKIRPKTCFVQYYESSGGGYLLADDWDGVSNILQCLNYIEQ